MRAYWLVALGVVLVTLLLFTVTLAMRAPWYGVLTSWPTGSTLKFARYWYHEGPAQLKFTMVENPPSAEFPTLASRTFYPSYLPGAVLPIYLISVCQRHEPTVAMIMNFGLANQLLIALLLAALVLVFAYARGVAPLAALPLALTPVVLELFLPGPFCIHQQDYFADMAVMLPFAAFLLLEALDRRVTHPRARAALAITQAVVMAYGVCVDWLFVFVVAVCLPLRLRRGAFGPGEHWRGMLRFAAPVLAAIALFCAQIVSLGVIPLMIGKAVLRMGVVNGDSNPQITGHFWRIVFGDDLSHLYGPLALPALLLALAVCLPWLYRRRVAAGARAASLVEIVALSLLPCLLQVLVFRQHSAYHAFSTLKFSLALATLPALFLLGGLTRTEHVARLRRYLPVCAGLLLCAALIYVQQMQWSVHQFYQAFDREQVLRQMAYAESLRARYGYNDVLFSSKFQIQDNPPQMLALSMKRVYLATSPADIAQVVKHLTTPYHIVLLDQPAHASSELPR